MSAELVAHIEGVLNLYAEPDDPQKPVVCFDETSTQLPAQTRPALPLRPGRLLRQDCEYRRERTRNLFLACEPLAAGGDAPTEHHAGTSPTGCDGWWMKPMRMSRWCVWSLDNLNTHRTASLYEAFPAGEARSIAQRLEFHYTPKHGSWLNPVLSLPKEWRRSSSAYCLVPAAEAPRRGDGEAGSRCPGTRAQCCPSHHQLAVQHPRRQNQTSPPLSIRFQT